MIDKLAFFAAILVAGVAVFYSVIGLGSIFGGAFIAVVVMASALEIGKLITATWLHLKWDTIPRWIKYYLTLAVGILMLITSIGIFGFLSKAHLDQEGVSGDAIAVVERVELRIEREEGKIATLQERIGGIGATEDVSDSVRQQEEIRDGAWARVQGDIDYAQGQIDAVQIRLQIDLQALDDIVASYTTQGTVTVGSVWNRETTDNVALGQEVREQQAPERSGLRDDANELIAGFQASIDRYRTQTQETINNANAEINRLRTGSAAAQDANIVKVDQLSDEIDGIYDDIVALNDEAFEARAIVRNLELEVGPIKYVAELIYGEQDAAQHFGQAVRMLILTLIFVFDPLAVLLLIATAGSWIIVKNKEEVETGVKVREKVVYVEKDVVKGGHSQEEHWDNLKIEEQQWLEQNAPTDKPKKWLKDLYNKMKTVTVEKGNIQNAEKNPPV
jgi:hypothetical protein